MSATLLLGHFQRPTFHDKNHLFHANFSCYCKEKREDFFSLHFITHRIFISVGWLFLFRKLYCQRLNDESFGCIGERTSSMHFRDLLRKDSRRRSSSVYIRNTSSFLVDEKQTEKPNIYALALRKKWEKCYSTRTLHKTGTEEKFESTKTD